MKTLISLALASSALLLGCGKAEKEDEQGELFARLSGSLQVPVSASRLKLFKAGVAGYGLSAIWQSCVKDGNTDNSQVIAGGAVLVESTATCTGTAYVAIKAQESADLSAFSAGTLEFTVEVSAVGQTLELLVQDAATLTSLAVDLSDFGFDPVKTAVPQAIRIPAASLATNGVDLAHLKRPFQVNLKCAGSQCQAKFDEIRWVGGAAADPKGVRSASIGVLQALPGGWPAAGALLAVGTSAGTYSFKVALAPDTASFLVVADPDTGFNYVALIPTETLTDDAETDLAVNVDLATSLAAMAQFPGGNPDGADYFEHASPQAFTNELAGAFRAYLNANTPASADPLALLEPALADPAVAQALDAGRATVGKGPATADSIVQANQATPPKFDVAVN